MTSSAASIGNACFRFSQLSPTDSALGERVLLEISDSEGLYTLAAGLKPISSGSHDMTVRIAPTIDTAALGRVEQLRRIAGALTCGDVGAFVQVFTATNTMRDSSVGRFVSLVVYHRGSVRAAVTKHSNFFATLGVTPSADAREVVLAVENAPRADRWRGYGYLFGYPDHAVDFFVEAGVVGDSTRVIVPRDFRRIETFRKFPDRAGGEPVNSSFVYAVPKGAATTPAERELMQSAAAVYTKYSNARKQYIRADSAGALALWRGWLRPN